MTTGPTEVRVDARPTADTPSSELLFGQFIELGYGLQVDSMRSELLFNPGFTRFAPYRPIAIDWFDLWHDRDRHESGYETDWSTYDWYHSGYEHNAWFAAPGPSPERLVGHESTFVVERSPLADVTVSQRDVRGARGNGGLVVENADAVTWSGVAQRSLSLRADGRYRYRIRMRAGASPAPVELRICAEGDWEHTIASVELGVPGADWSDHVGELSACGFSGRATVFVCTAPGGAFVLDEVSLRTTDEVSGWRHDAVEAVRRVHPGVIRWPGGCTASLYDWRSAVGPVGRRPALPGYFWGGLEDNAIGVAELARLAIDVGAESMVCINMHHPLKAVTDSRLDDGTSTGYRLGRFADPTEGIRSAADLVAYCNLRADVPDAHPMALLRAAHGYPEPFGVRFWEMENEPVRWFEQDEYAQAVVDYSRAMKSVDPTIEIGIVTYAWDAGGGSPNAQAIPELLQIAGSDVDFLADRGFGEADLREKLDAMRAFNAAHGTRIRYCNTEWLAYDGVADEQNRHETAGITKSYLFASWRYALNIARHYLMWQRYGDDVLFVNFNNLANTHGQNVIDTPKETAGLSAAGRVFELLSRSPARRPLVTRGAEPAHDAEFQVQVALDATGQRVVVTAVSLSEREREVYVDLRALGVPTTRCETTTLSADGPYARDLPGVPAQIRREQTIDHPDTGQLALTVPGWSIVHAVLS